MQSLLLYIASLCLFFLTQDLTANLQQEVERPSHKIVYLISPSRSLSVAFTRMMYERGDFEIFHEPSQFVYNKKYWGEEYQRWYRPDSYATFDDVKQHLYAAAEKRPVFVKEMSFAVEELLLNDSEFIQNEKIHFVFLMRNPHHSTISFYKRLYEIVPRINELIGCESLYHVFQKVESEAKNKPIIFFTEDLFDSPYKTVEALCNQLNIAFIPKALHWSSLDPSFDFQKEWHELKVPGSVDHWHGEAIRSTGFSKPAGYAVGRDGSPTFEEIEDISHRDYYRKAYLHNLTFYNLVKDKVDFQLFN